MNMIYVSSCCSKQKRICYAIEELVEVGIRNIELSGGTEYYVDYEDDILRLKDRFDLNYLVHNYFPPPQEDFVINLASLDDDVYDKSLQQLHKSIQLCHKIGAKKFGFHAGFFVDLNFKELGNVIGRRYLKNRELSIKKFCEGFKRIQQEAYGIDLYLENNVYTYSNYCVYKNSVPFMLLNLHDYKELKNSIDFKLLLDLAHLKVNVNTLGLNSNKEFDYLMNESDYLHISENDGVRDQNKGLTESSDLIKLLKRYDLQNKIITIEVYDTIETVIQSCEVLSSIIDGYTYG